MHAVDSRGLFGLIIGSPRTHKLFPHIIKSIDAVGHSWGAETEEDVYQARRVAIETEEEDVFSSGGSNTGRKVCCNRA